MAPYVITEWYTYIVATNVITMFTSKPINTDKQYSRDELLSTGVYSITNRENGFVYYGSASGSKGFRNRWIEHIYDLSRGEHHSPILQNHWRKYGESCFVFAIELICPPQMTLEAEQQLIDTRGVGYKNKSYNTCPVAGNTAGVPNSPQAIEAAIKVVAKPYHFIDAQGIEYSGVNLHQFARDMGLDSSCLSKLMRGKLKSYKGFRKYVSGMREFGYVNHAYYKLVGPDGTVYEGRNLQAFAREMSEKLGTNINACNLASVLKGDYRSHKGFTLDGTVRPKKPTNRLSRQKAALTQARRVAPFGYVFRCPKGATHHAASVTGFAKQMGLNRSCLNAVLWGQRASHKGWIVIKLQEPYEDWKTKQGQHS